MYSGIGRSLGTDYFKIADQLTREELRFLRRTRDFVDDEVLPVINEYWERAEFPWPLVRKLAGLGIVGDGIKGYGCPPMSPIATGLVHDAVDRDARIRRAENSLAARDGPAGATRRVRAH